MGIAQNICTPIIGGDPGAFPNTFGILGNSWLSLAMLALLVSLFSLALLYIFAAFLRNQQLFTWVKFELFQIFATAIVVAFTFMFVIGMCNFDMSFLSSRYIDPVTHNYLNMYEIVDDYYGQLQDVGYTLFYMLMVVVKQINLLAKITWLSSPLGVGSNETPLESFGQLNNVLFLMVSGYVVSFLLIGMQWRMLEYLSIAVLYYLFPFGIFFRAFEPTRPFGGTLIGISLTLFLFYPMLLVFNDFILYEPMASIKAEMSGQLDTTNTVLGTDPYNPDKLSAGVTDLAHDAMREGFISGIVGSLLLLIKPIMLYFVGAVILPVINFIVLVETARGLTKLLGEEIDLTNLTRLI